MPEVGCSEDQGRTPITHCSLAHFPTESPFCRPCSAWDSVLIRNQASLTRDGAVWALCPLHFYSTPRNRLEGSFKLIALWLNYFLKCKRLKTGEAGRVRGISLPTGFHLCPGVNKIELHLHPGCEELEDVPQDQALRQLQREGGVESG